TSGGGLLAPYILNVPVKNIDYPIIAGTPSDPPVTPTNSTGSPLVACPTNLTVPAGQSVPFSVSATDPDGDSVRYGFDWLNSGTVNEWVPASGYVPSGTTQTVSHTWNSGGTYQVKANAQDNHGATSGWSNSCTITVTGNVGQCADGVDNDSDGYTDCADRGCHTDGNASNAASCNPERVENPQCSDTVDNDGDATADTQDPGCHTDANAGNAASYNPGDDNEVNTQCSDGIDNDGNGTADLADATGCTSLTDDSESSNSQLSLALAASSSVVQSGQPATLAWSASNVQSGTCRITGTNGAEYSYDSGVLPGTSGQVTTTNKPLTSQVTFTLTCQNLSSQSVSTSAIVKVAPSSGEF
ncbi:MAG: PKD domain-containing protein, partial [Patescibacteria group bacterium]